MLPVSHQSAFTRRHAVAAGLAVPLLAAVPAQAVQESSPPATVTEEMIRELERTRLRALIDFDKAVAGSLHAEDFQLINPAGIALSKAEYLGDLESGFVNYSVFEPVSEVVVHLAPGSAVLRYMSDIALTLDGTEIPLSNYWHTDYYEHRDGRWQIVLSQATEILT